MLVIGVAQTMTAATDATPGLWRSFMPRRNEISGRVSTSYISMRVYLTPGVPIAEKFAPDTAFQKWAAVEVADAAVVPDGMQSHTIEGGLYAVFKHSGPASRFPDTMRYIFAAWLPRSAYELDDREQFEIVPENWRPDDENASEDIYIPIRKATLKM
jgi:AraC family transcriptional regulator